MEGATYHLALRKQAGIFPKGSQFKCNVIRRMEWALNPTNDGVFASFFLHYFKKVDRKSCIECKKSVIFIARLAREADRNSSTRFIIH